MSRRTVLRRALAISLVALLMLAFAAPALAGDIITGEDIITIEDTDDDVYALGGDIIVEGRIEGDLIASSGSLTINGEITGDLIYVGGSVTLNGRIGDDARVGSAAFFMGSEAQIGDDLNYGGHSLEMRPGSSIGGSLLMGGSQALIADVAGDVYMGGEGARVSGTIGGDANFALADAGAPVVPVSTYFQGNPEIVLPPISNLESGLELAEGGEVLGDLTLQAPTDSGFDFGSQLQGEFTYEPAPQPEVTESPVVNSAVKPVGKFIMTFALLVIIGMVFLQVAPGFLNRASDTLLKRFLPVLGVGFLAYMGLGLILLLLILLVVAGFALGQYGIGGPLFSFVSLTGGGVMSAFSLATRWLGPLLVALPLGAGLYQIFSKEGKSEVWQLVLGSLVISLLLVIPFLGGFLVRPILGLLGIGAVTLTLMSKPEAKSGPEADHGDEEESPTKPLPAAKTVGGPQLDVPPTKPN